MNSKARKKNADADEYPFLWLDDLVCRKLNPRHGQLKLAFPDDSGTFEREFSDELWAVFNGLKGKMFGLLTDGEVAALVQHYLVAAAELSEQAMRNLAAYAGDDAAGSELSEFVIASLRDFELAVRSRYDKYLVVNKGKGPSPASGGMLFKVLCKLSVDQIGIILKACDDTKLLLAKSLSIVFQSIVPYLSTERMEEVSWGSMRKSTYQFSRADLELVIAVLERLIAKIREYF